MAQAQDDFTRITSPAAVESLLDQLIEPGGASLLLDKPASSPQPVLLTEQVVGESLLLDVTAIREVSSQLKRGLGFRLLGQIDGKMVRTPMLKAENCSVSGDRVVCVSDYPLYLEELQRRESFRARLRLGMEVGAILRGDDDASAQGDLKDLSLEGCQLELPASVASLLATSAHPLEIELCFPDGTRFTVKGSPRHQASDPERQALRVGFRFEAITGEQERKLWYFVREIEREAMRSAGDGDNGRLPSLLFQAQSATPPAVGRRNLLEYPTPMARRLARVAGYLDAQLLELQQDGRLDSVQLSRHADRLLMLADEDAEALLFATRCLDREPLLVRHGLAVAVHLLSLAGGTSVPRDVRKAMAACAMVHDLGKGLLPRSLLEAKSFGPDERAQLEPHVATVLDGLESCHWLSASVARSVVGGINERLDGSGYPGGLASDQLHELARMSAVVDVVDAMRRDRADRPAWSIDSVYRHLLKEPGLFDPRWVKRYIQCFGLRPVGSLVRFKKGELGWIQRLDAQKRPFQVQLTERIEPPGEALGRVIRGDVVGQLGEPVEEVPVST
ncbi:HD domain-containing phosphohydrolase [Billgrantia gudaonensis]|uniref:HD domain-containing protein n=1 Tax=Billgrantia gudaonensis TaxID=376427 RepID=A0A1G8VGL5_9GAMM|nr:HD domain-containing phosphohydrolase [Halomonas gudaonensis]SDJ65099.1 HD domain-containing protein [Halomonas gudaonensis]